MLSRHGFICDKITFGNSRKKQIQNWLVKGDGEVGESGGERGGVNDDGQRLDLGSEHTIQRCRTVGQL